MTVAGGWVQRWPQIHGRRQGREARKEGKHFQCVTSSFYPLPFLLPNHGLHTCIRLRATNTSAPTSSPRARRRQSCRTTSSRRERKVKTARGVSSPPPLANALNTENFSSSCEPRKKETLNALNNAASSTSRDSVLQRGSWLVTL